MPVRFDSCVPDSGINRLKKRKTANVRGDELEEIRWTLARRCWRPSAGRVRWPSTVGGCRSLAAAVRRHHGQPPCLRVQIEITAHFQHDVCADEPPVERKPGEECAVADHADGSWNPFRGL